MNKRVNLSFSSDEFELIEALAVKTNRKVGNLVKTWTLDRLNSLTKKTDIIDEEEAAILSDKKLVKRLRDGYIRSKSGKTLKKSKYINP